MAGMLPILIAGLAALAVVVIAIGISMSGGGGVASRLERYASGRSDASGESESPESAVVAGLSRVMERQDLNTRLSVDLARADLKMKPAEFLLAWAATPFLFVTIAFVLGFLFTGSVKLAGSIATTEVITKLGLFYLHERAWDRFSWGRSAKPKSSAHTYPAVAEATA